jgi:hypothetical protein
MLLLIFENLPPWPVEIDHRCIDFDDDFSQYVTNSAWIGLLRQPEEAIGEGQVYFTPSLINVLYQ